MSLHELEDVQRVLAVLKNMNLNATTSGSKDLAETTSSIPYWVEVRPICNPLLVLCTNSVQEKKRMKDWSNDIKEGRIPVGDKVQYTLEDAEYIAESLGDIQSAMKEAYEEFAGTLNNVCAFIVDFKSKAYEQVDSSGNPLGPSELSVSDSRLMLKGIRQGQ